jgi:hypothetical protein
LGKGAPRRAGFEDDSRLCRRRHHGVIDQDGLKPLADERGRTPADALGKAKAAVGQPDPKAVKAAADKIKVALALALRQSARRDDNRQRHHHSQPSSVQNLRSIPT